MPILTPSVLVWNLCDEVIIAKKQLLRNKFKNLLFLSLIIVKTKKPKRKKQMERVGKKANAY